MTAKQKDALGCLFERYGRQQEDVNQTVNIYLMDPQTVQEMDRLQRQDQSAAQSIERLSELLEGLEAYRIACAERYAYLATAPTVPGVRLKRERDYRGNKVFYVLTTFRRDLNTGGEVVEARTSYPGAQRWEAIAAYREYVKDHPGILAEMDIKK